MAVRDEKFRIFTDQPVMLERKRKIREKGQSYYDKLRDLYNFFSKDSRRIFIIILGHVV
jgi:hypothetical protein